MSLDNESKSRNREIAESLGAYLSHLRGDDSGALAALEGKNDSQSVKKKLDILLDKKQFSEAAAFARAIALDVAWCDKAVHAFAQDGDFNTAETATEWAFKNADRTTWRRCLLRFAEARYHRALQRFPLNEPILPGDLSPDEAAVLRKVVEVLEPNLKIVESNLQIDNEIESLSIQLALHASSLIGDYARSEHFGKLLGTRTPVPLALACFALDHTIKAPSDLAEKLKAQHPDSLRARFLAVLLEGTDQHPPAAAFESAKELIGLAADDDERMAVCGVLHEFAQRIGPEELSEVDTLASTLLPADNRFRRQLAIQRLLIDGSIEAARDSLSRIKDEKSSTWLQLQGLYLLRVGDGRSAADYFVQASKLYHHPLLMRLAAQMAVDHGRLPQAQSVLLRLLTKEPDAIVERKNLAFIYVRQNLFDKAAAEFAILEQKEPNEVSHRFNRALSLRHAGHISESIEVFNAVCDSADPPMRAILLRAELLKIDGQAEKGFDSLIAHKNRFWDNYEFVGTVLDLASAAQRDHLVPEALHRLGELQAQGKAPEGVLRAVSLEDLKQEMLRYRERSDSIHGMVLQHRAPWLFAEGSLRRPWYWAWSIRTQELAWLSDDPLLRSQFTVYATNGFHVHAPSGSPTVLEQISSSAKGKPVVADITALITLDSLGMLENAASYFGSIHIPAEYVTHAVDQLEQLRDHQPSRRASLEAIKAALDAHRLNVAANADKPGVRPFPYVSEHTLDDDHREHYYRLVDISAPLHSSGRISESERKAIDAVSHKPTGVDTEHRAIGAGAPILVELATLMTISQCGLLKPVTESFTVYIADSDRDEVDSELRGFHLQESVRKKHEDLWRRIQADDRFVPLPVERPAEWGDPQDTDAGLISMLLAQSESASLLADDRVLQAIVSNARIAEIGVSFGTDALMASMLADGAIDDVLHDRSILRLMNWRYRFLTPPPAMLKRLALEFINAPPGKSLLSVAKYFHDCMTDPGLLKGFEPTQPPMSIAGRLFLTLTRTVIGFVVELWADNGISESSAEKFTDWAIKEMLPLVPSAPGVEVPNIANYRSRLIMSHALIQAISIENVDRAHKGIRTIAHALGLTGSEYWTDVTEVIHAT